MIAEKRYRSPYCPAPTSTETREAPDFFEAIRSRIPSLVGVETWAQGMTQPLYYLFSLSGLILKIS